MGYVLMPHLILVSFSLHPSSRWISGLWRDELQKGILGEKEQTEGNSARSEECYSPHVWKQDWVGTSHTVEPDCLWNRLTLAQHSVQRVWGVPHVSLNPGGQQKAMGSPESFSVMLLSHVGEGSPFWATLTLLRRTLGMLPPSRSRSTDVGTIL